MYGLRFWWQGKMIDLDGVHGATGGNRTGWGCSFGYKRPMIFALEGLELAVLCIQRRNRCARNDAQEGNVRARPCSKVGP